MLTQFKISEYVYSVDENRFSQLFIQDPYYSFMSYVPFRTLLIMVLHNFLSNLICYVIYFEELLKSSFSDFHPQILLNLIFLKTENFSVLPRISLRNLTGCFFYIPPPILNTSRQISLWISGVRSSLHYTHRLLPWSTAWLKLWFVNLGTAIVSSVPEPDNPEIKSMETG